MSRIITVGAAQMGPIQRGDDRKSVVARLLALMAEAHGKGCDLIVYPELALTTFFPRWLMEDQEEIDGWFESAMPSNETQPLFNAAKEYGLGFHLGYAELARENGETHRYNTAIMVDKQGHMFAKFRKIHIPGHADYEPTYRYQHLEKRYFEVGDLGFPVWKAFGGHVGMAICNDRRWPETYRVMGLQDVEMVLIGYNTQSLAQDGSYPAHLSMFHNHLSMQAGAYQNSTWVVGVAKAGCEEGIDMIGGSAIIAPTGEIAAQCITEEDELIVHDCDLDACKPAKEDMFNFAAHWRIEHYGLIAERTAAKPPSD